MAQIIDIRERLRVRHERTATGPDGQTEFEVRLCGPDRRWLGLVGGIVARALAGEGFHTVFDDLETAVGAPSVLILRAGRQPLDESRGGHPPGLVVTGAAPAAAALQGCNSRSVLLTVPQDHWSPAGQDDFPGIEIPLPVTDPAPEPIDLAAACAGGAARLLGVIRWQCLEQALREELLLADGFPIDYPLALAFEAYHRLAPWEGVVATATPPY
ncbi:MAG: hypothetical protein IH614_10590 [Desulfuromonadales bacterium]|nr:hypothetical protein [Desulfuromonadales bacterium]